MQISEIRWATGIAGGQTQRFRMPIGLGVTWIRLAPTEKSELFFPRLQSELIYAPDGSERADSWTPDQYWQFIFREEDLFFSYSSDQSTHQREHFFRQSIIGCESSTLEGRLDYSLLAGMAASADKRRHVEQLLLRLDQARCYLFDRRGPAGRILSLQADLEDCRDEMSRLDDVAGESSSILPVIEQMEKKLSSLRAEDRQLAGEQTLIKHQLNKEEYETLIHLRGQLSETLEREGVYGARITEKGHNITVHEMTQLTGLRKEIADLQARVQSLEQTLLSTREERIQVEQERILTVRQLEGYKREQEEIGEQIRQSGEEADHQLEDVSKNKNGQRFSTASFRWLLALLVLSAGLLFLLIIPTLGWVLAGLGLLALVLLGAYTVWQIHAVRIRWMAQGKNQEALSSLRSHLHQMTARIATLSVKLDRLENYIAELDEKEAEVSLQAETDGRQLRRMESELMRSIRPYAEPSEKVELDHVLQALSRQRESSAYYNEFAADLERRIAELKHGRSDEEMKREYERASKSLSELGGALIVDDLHTRAGQLTQSRINLASAMDELEAELKRQRQMLTDSREALVMMSSLQRKHDTLSDALIAALDDFHRMNAAAAWLKELLGQWKEIDPVSWMIRSSAYLSRMTGRRPGRSRPTPVEGKVRSPRLAGAPLPGRPAGLIDHDLFAAAPQSARYLALRLGLAALETQAKESTSPLFLLEPSIPSGYSQIQYFVDTLEEWAMETGRQLVCLTANQVLISLAEERKMNIYYLG
jgi:hypothetical protein